MLRFRTGKHEKTDLMRNPSVGPPSSRNDHAQGIAETKHVPSYLRPTVNSTSKAKETKKTGTTKSTSTTSEKEKPPRLPVRPTSAPHTPTSSHKIPPKKEATSKGGPTNSRIPLVTRSLTRRTGAVVAQQIQTWRSRESKSKSPRTSSSPVAGISSSPSSSSSHRRHPSAGVSPRHSLGSSKKPTDADVFRQELEEFKALSHREKTELEAKLEVLNEEVKRKDEDIRELDYRFKQLNNEITKTKNFNKQLQAQMVRICSIQGSQTWTEGTKPNARKLEEDKVALLKGHFMAVFTQISQKLSEEKEALREVQEDYHDLMTALQLLKTQYAAEQIRHHVREHQSREKILALEQENQRLHELVKSPQGDQQAEASGIKEPKVTGK